MSRNHTIRDVAREAGVSVATVSRVLEQQARCLRQTPARRSNWRSANSGTPAARNGSSSRRARPGPSRCCSRTPTRNPSHIYLDFIAGVTSACEERDYRLDLVMRSLDERELLDLYRSSKSDGTVLMRVQLSDWRVELLREMSLPFVMLGHTEEPCRRELHRLRLRSCRPDRYGSSGRARPPTHRLRVADAVAGEPTRPDDASAPCVHQRLRRARPPATALPRRSRPAAHPPDDDQHACRSTPRSRHW